MAYPDKLLANDERVAAHLHPHWGTLIPAGIWFVVLCAAAGAAGYFAPASGPAHTAVDAVIGVLGLVLLVWLVLRPWLRWRTTHYVFTTRRVMLRRGVVRHEGRDIGLGRINDVAFVQSLGDRLVGSGTLTIESAGEHGAEVLANLPHADRVQQLLNELIDEDFRRVQDERLRRYPSGSLPPRY